MPDTVRDDFPDLPCSDCGEEEKGQVYIKHWGPLVPPGAVGNFGPDCWAARMLLDRSGTPRPLGTPYEHGAHLADDVDLLHDGFNKIERRGKDKEKLLALLKRLNEAKERFAEPRQMFEEAARLRDMERSIQALLKD